MARDTDFTHAVTPVDADWLDRLQEVISGLATNARVVSSSATQVQVVPGDADGGNISLTINGKLRYTGTVKTLSISGAAGTYNIFATADIAAPDFALVSTTAASPVGVTNYRKIATVVWSGTAITTVTSLLGAPPTTNPTFTGIVTVPTPVSTSDDKTAANTEWVNDAIMASMPMGSVLDYVLPTLPTTGWRWANGAALTAADTPATALRNALIAAGNPFGVSGTDPLLPDYRGRVGVGLDNLGGIADAGRLSTANTLGLSGGAETVTLITANLPSHNHPITINDTGHDHGGSTAGGTADFSSSVTTNGVGAHTHGPGVDAYFRTAGGAGQLQLATGLGGTSGYYAEPYTWTNALTNANGAHDHTISAASLDNAQSIHYHGINSGTTGITASAGVTGSGTAVNKMPPHLMVGKIVKL